MIIGYVRVSTIEQNESRQLETMKMYNVEKIFVENYIIMPNHIHMLIFIDEYKNGTMRASSPTKLDTIVRSLKTMVTRETGISIWQRSYYDEIIRDEKHFQYVWNYIEYNALKEYPLKEEKI